MPASDGSAQVSVTWALPAVAVGVGALLGLTERLNVRVSESGLVASASVAANVYSVTPLDSEGVPESVRVSAVKLSPAGKSGERL